jgi:4,5-dihydroxyphthalate decarboxylase
MDSPSLTLIMRDYDYLALLYGGDVTPEGVHLTIDRTTPITQAYTDSSIVASELSFSRFLIGLSKGDRSFVGIPFFPTRGFRHRCFYVHRARPLSSLKELEGRRVGTNSWPDTGNTWTRAVLRDQSVRIDHIKWHVGPLDEKYPKRPQSGLPPFVREVAGRYLRDMLLEGELDALMCPFPPIGFYDNGSPIIRLIADYRAAEREYYARKRIYPVHHVIGLRRDLFERTPQIGVAIYQALDRARLLWQQRRLFMAELTPWMLVDIEDTMALLGTDWQPSGVTPNKAAIAALCDEELAQGLVDRPLDPETVFAEFDAVLKT